MSEQMDTRTRLKKKTTTGSLPGSRESSPSSSERDSSNSSNMLQIISLCNKALNINKSPELTPIIKEIISVARRQPTLKDNALDVKDMMLSSILEMKDGLERNGENLRKLLDLNSANERNYESRLESCLSGLENRLSSLEGKITEERQVRTYSNVVKGGARTCGEHSMVICSKELNQSSEEIENVVKKTINVRTSGIGISRVKRISKEKLLIECMTEKDKSMMKEEITTKIGLQVQDVRKKNPLVIFKGVIKGITEDDINESLKSQNKSLKIDENIRVKFIKRNRNTLMSNIVCQVNADTWKQLLRLGKIGIGYQWITVEDFSPVLQCYNCLAYGHTKKFCKDESKCQYCSGDHKWDECPVKNNGDPPKCIHCVERKEDNINHTATSRSCPIWQHKDKQARLLTDYGHQC